MFPSNLYDLAAWCYWTSYRIAGVGRRDILTREAPQAGHQRALRQATLAGWPVPQ